MYFKVGKYKNLSVDDCKSIENVMIVSMPVGTVSLQGELGRIELYYETNIRKESLDEFISDNPDKLIIVYPYSSTQPHWNQLVMDSETFEPKKDYFIRVAALNLTDEQKELVFKDNKIITRKYLLITTA